MFESLSHHKRKCNKISTFFYFFSILELEKSMNAAVFKNESQNFTKKAQFLRRHTKMKMGTPIFSLHGISSV